MAILRLKPAYKDYIWGGTRLRSTFNKNYDGGRLAESWELSCHEDGLSVIDGGIDGGKTLRQYIREKGKEVLGTNCRMEETLPVLIKLIDAADDLSVQVHPDDRFAMAEEGEKGKTEMWYVIDCARGAFLYYGFSRTISEREFMERIKDRTLPEVLNKVYVKKGDVLLIEAGTIHAIGRDIMIAEIQENSNITYRIYDYGRIGKDGRPRRLDIEKALRVTDRNPVVQKDSFSPHLAVSDYFTVDKLFLDGTHMKSAGGFAGRDSFTHFLFLDGEGSIQTRDDILRIRKGDSIFLPAGTGEYMLNGRMEALITRV